MHDDAVADLPDYYVPRPAMPRGAVLDDFERLYAEQIEPVGHRVIDYRLPVAKWQFLCWLTASGTASRRRRVSTSASGEGER
jgi:hypothetical protein